ncbi:DNA repair protein RecO [Profundibacter sp.]|uniref:DNA repair protein RecO n=1 Tax=Profundibacter sp. TaxID=3101071 RepID=UPI003D0D0815
MEWRDQGVLQAVRKHGENSAIIEVFTAEHGRHAGVVRGASSRKMAPVLQPGAQLAVTWRARLADHLGSYTVEPLRSRAAAVMADRLTLSALNSICALLAFALPEREAHPLLYQRSVTLFDLLGNTEGWPLAYLRWELALLEDLGFGLDLRRCAVNGSRDDLAYVSPKSGRAVSAEGAGEWADRLLPLPLCLLGQGPAPDSEIIDGLRLTGHFLTHWLAYSLGNKPLPAARQRFVDAYVRHT